MKTKVIIENGETTIQLFPENVFEVDIIEKVYKDKKRFAITTSFDCHSSYGDLSRHVINMNISEIR